MPGRLKSLPKRLQCLNRPNLNLRGDRYNPAHYQNAHPTMKLPYLGILLGTAFLCHPVQAVTYICKIDGKAAYSSVKINSSCQKSQMDGISEERPKQKAQTGAASDVAVENTDRDDISEIWEEATYGTYDDIKILPRVSDGPTNSAAPKLEVKLRNQPKAPLKTAPAGPAPIRTAAPIYNAAPSKPKLSRNQILQKEIDNERAALARTRGQLELTRQKGGDIGALAALGIALIISVAAFMLIVSRLPSSKLWNKMVLRTSSREEAGYVSAAQQSELVGKTGEVLTELRPSGTVRIDGRPVDVISEGAFIQKGAQVVVLSVNGSRIVVREA